MEVALRADFDAFQQFFTVEQKRCGIKTSVRLISSVISLLQFINLTEGKLLTFILSPFSAFQEIIFVWLLRSLNNLRENIINKQAVR